MSRTIVLSDCHGSPHLITNALRDANFDPEVDDLVFAGDFLDIGPDPLGCLDILLVNGADILIGNHEWAIVRNQQIYPQDAISWNFRDTLVDFIRQGYFQAVCQVGDVIISHAGLSQLYISEVEERGLECTVIAINERFKLSVDLDYTALEFDDYNYGVFWFRPDTYAPLPGVTQVVGHTPPELLSRDFKRYITVDPFARMFFDENRFRYVTIQDGKVEVHDSGALRKSENFDPWRSLGIDSDISEYIIEE